MPSSIGMKPKIHRRGLYWVLTYRAPHTICSLKFATWGEAMGMVRRLYGRN